MLNKEGLLRELTVTVRQLSYLSYFSVILRIQFFEFLRKPPYRHQRSTTEWFQGRKLSIEEDQSWYPFLSMGGWKFGKHALGSWIDCEEISFRRGHFLQEGLFQTLPLLQYSSCQGDSYCPSFCCPNILLGHEPHLSPSRYCPHQKWSGRQVSQQSLQSWKVCLWRSTL